MGAAQTRTDAGNGLDSCDDVTIAELAAHWFSRYTTSPIVPNFFGGRPPFFPSDFSVENKNKGMTNRRGKKRTSPYFSYLISKLWKTWKNTRNCNFKIMISDFMIIFYCYRATAIKQLMQMRRTFVFYFYNSRGAYRWRSARIARSIYETNTYPGIRRFLPIVSWYKRR